MEESLIKLSDVIAGLSLFVSLFALGWAKASASAAERANDFQLHTYQKETYVQFFKLWLEFQRSYVHLGHEHVFAFNDYARTAPLYFEDDLAKRIDAFHTLCWQMTNKNALRNRVLQDIQQYDNDLFEVGFVQKLKRENDELWHELIDMGGKANERGRALNEEIKAAINILRRKPNVFQRLAKLYTDEYDWDNEGHPSKDRRG